MNTIALILLVTLVAIRIIECYVFVKKVSKTCESYDWKHVETNELLLLEMLEKEDYYTTSEWSAYNFLYLKGPNPLSLFFSLKPITIEAQYDKKVLKKLNQYEIK